MRNKASLLLVFMLFTLACSGQGMADSNPTTYVVTYSITGTADRVSITYENAQGGTEQMDSVRVPWSKSVSVKAGQFVYISAQNQGEIGSVTCRIMLDGISWKESTSSGAYVIATCSGSAGRE